MTNPPQSGSTPPGWYPDPSGVAQTRWWDGQRWTEHAGGGQPGQQFGAQLAAPAIPPAYSYAVPRRREISLETPVNTPYIWVFVLLPLLSLITLSIWIPSFTGALKSQMDQAIANPNDYSASAFSVFSPLYVLTLLSSLVVYGGGVLMAFFDHRELVRRGVERPFHWAWSFLYALVYVIGRTVIVRGVAQKRGMAPLWVYIGMLALSLVISIVFAVQILSTVFGTISTLYPS